jgi:hypothetical protein
MNASRPLSESVEMSRCPRILTAILLFASLWLNHAASDVSPSPMTGGQAVSPYEDGPTDVRMVAEDVVVRIYADSVVTVGSFSMRNDGETVRMEVGFPFSRTDDLIRFRAFVDGRPMPVRLPSRQSLLHRLANGLGSLR